MRTVGPVNREYVLFNKNIIIKIKNIKRPQGAMGTYCSYSVLNIKSFVFPSMYSK